MSPSPSADEGSKSPSLRNALPPGGVFPPLTRPGPTATQFVADAPVRQRYSGKIVAKLAALILREGRLASHEFH